MIELLCLLTVMVGFILLFMGLAQWLFPYIGQRPSRGLGLAAFGCFVVWCGGLLL